MKKTLCFLLATLTLLLCVGCNVKTPSQDPEQGIQQTTQKIGIPYERSQPDGTWMQVIGQLEKRSFEDLTVVSVGSNGIDNYLFQEVFDRSEIPAISRRSGILSYTEYIPLEYVAFVNDACVYAVHKLNIEGTIVYRYTILKKVVYEGRENWRENEIQNHHTGKVQIGNGEPKEKQFNFNETYNVIKKLSSNDFVAIQKGNTAQSVCDVDPIVQYDLADLIGLRSYHLLTDGLLLIEYERTGEGYELEDYTVTSKTFYPYGTDDPAAQDYKILQAKEPIELP